jgi:hypothetical protein
MFLNPSPMFVKSSCVDSKTLPSNVAVDTIKILGPIFIKKNIVLVERVLAIGNIAVNTITISQVHYL